MHKTEMNQKQQATTNCCEKQQRPSLVKTMETKSTHREGKGVLVGEWGALFGEMTYPSLSALVDGAGAGTVTVPTLSSLI